jgi:hypothetical protein
MWSDLLRYAFSISMFMAPIISCFLRVLLKVAIALFVPSRLLLKSFSNIFYEKHRSFELFSYSNFLFRLWANPILRALRDSLVSPDGAHVATMLP